MMPEPRCTIVPQPHRRFSFRIDGIEKLAWESAADAPRPFFFPVRGPSGHELTRVGHPGAPNHDHHRSVWFAHQKVTGIDFWSDTSPSFIRQNRWLAIQDGEQESLLGVELEWFDGHDPAPLLTQQLLISLSPLNRGEWLLELQSQFTPTAESLEFQKTNFGFLAVRVSSSLSEYFGNGQLTNSDGRIHEANIFGKKARWMDYSGQVAGSDLRHVLNGITYFDHPSNPGFPSGWHVREDGWMGASVCMSNSLTTTRESPLALRYLLHIHGGGVDKTTAEQIAQAFDQRPLMTLLKGSRKHISHEIVREE